jgi:tetratricopeptide (TPR) repeat protein
LNPAAALAYFYRALAWKAKGDLARAIADYDQAIALNRNYAEAYAQRGLARLQQGKEVEAEKDFARCLELAPEMWASLAPRIKELKSKNQP